MRVYGDHAWLEDPAEKLRRIRDGGSSHAELVDRLIEAGELWQGVADAQLERDGCDRRSPLVDACAALAVALARKVWRSWQGQPVGAVELPRMPRAGLPQRIRCSLAEGYAFYALYPETYAAAAARALPPNARVIGIRSIGTSLAAMVVAGADGRVGAGTLPLPISVRPVGHPFQRRLALSPELQGELREWARAGAPVAVVDEGPGLSGSSFAAVAEAWASCGGAPGALHFFPSHLGDLGPHAPEDRRRAWASARKHLVPFEEEVFPRLRLTVQGDPRDLSGGAWRNDRPPLVPSITWQERRKYLAGGWLLKFRGLGRAGRESFARARALADEGFIPGVQEGWHGFTAHSWVEGEQLDRSSAVDRGALVRHVARYLRFRARALPAPPGSPGASLEELLDAARFNAREAGADGLARTLERFRKLPAPGPLVQIDGRMQRWEWIASPGGRLWKADATDHCLGHDLVGAQPIDWDVAGAAVELSLDEQERALIARRAGAALESLPFFEACYRGFQLGRALLGADSVAGAEADLLRAEAARYLTVDRDRRTPAGPSSRSPRR